MKRFFLSDSFTIDEIIDVPQEIVRHIHVLRMSLGELIEIFNGQNQSYIGEIINLGKRNATIKIIRINPVTSLPTIQISLAIAMVANDKMDLIVQKAVELGVSHIIPLHSEYSARLIKSRSDSRLSHWQNIIISSCAQCGQNLLPSIDLPIDMHELFTKTNYDIKIIMNTPHAEARLIKPQQPKIHDQKNISNALLLVGPEGGFSSNEIELAISNNYQTMQLGNLVMRAETAVIAGLAALNLRLNQWMD